ncbi:hypothetical protein [Fusobacterium mortiferum]|uniref:hypothetical protein n=1 Tax=Fusobacterium mortiferum TaxID=850 RepID=UPI00158C3DDD|nr:hypothetical protein [Fusobacterium mortiferum]
MENLDTRVAESLASGKKIIDEVAYDLLAKEIIALIKTKAESSHTHSADQVTETDSKKFVSPQEKKTWGDKVSQEQLTAAINTFASGLAFKGVYETLEALNTKITQPQEGYMVIITKEPTYSGKNTILIYEGDPTNKWQTVGELFVPGLATQSQDGLMSKEDKKKLDGIQAGANNYTHPSSHPASMITEDTSHRFVTDAEKTKWNKAATDSASALQQVRIANQTANTAKSTADSALSKATTVETALNNTMTEKEAQAIINKYKGA